MNDDKIIEIAERYGRLENIYPGLMLIFAKDALLDFAKAVVEARLAEDNEEPVAWLTENGSIFRSHEIASIGQENGPYPLYRHPPPARKLTDDDIEEIHREFPSRVDLFARAIEQKIWRIEQ